MKRYNIPANYHRFGYTTPHRLLDGSNYRGGIRY